ncbi:hypothetical protein Tco_1049943 [Tanacetum coccineum]
MVINYYCLLKLMSADKVTLLNIQTAERVSTSKNGLKDRRKDKEVIENGNAPPITKVVECVETTIAHATAEEKAQKSTNSTNGAVNTTHGATMASTQATTITPTTIDNLSDVVIYAFFVSQPNSPQLNNEDLQQIHPDYLEEMDLKWQMLSNNEGKGDS